jgi:hypothetical protein
VTTVLGLIIAIVLVAVFAYLASLRIRPLAKCRVCMATGRHFGQFSNSYRRCRACGGGGRKDRLGTKILFGGTGDTGIYPAGSRRESAKLRESLQDRGASAALRLARWINGSEDNRLPPAWDADLYGDPTKERPSSRKRLRLALGFVRAGITIRLERILKRLTDRAWQPVDATLGSWRGTRLAVLAPVTTATIIVVYDGGLSGLVANAANLGYIATASYLAIKGLQRYRDISPPKKPRRQKKPVDNGPGQGPGH